MAIDDDALDVDIRPSPETRKEPEVNKLFRAVMKHEGSDLHLKAGLPPMMRHRNVLKPFGKLPLSQEDMERLMYPIISTRLRETLEETGGCDFAHVVGQDESRFRVNLFRQRGKLSVAARRVNNKVPTFAGLGLPPSIESLCHFDQGMILLAGITGSGKS